MWMKTIFYDLIVKYKGSMNPIRNDKAYRDRHLTKEKLNSGLIVTTHVRMEFKVADVFTKGFPVARFQ
ncbi:hypothetical protein CR513_40626, partial [Mucuna pruriens]